MAIAAAGAKLPNPWEAVGRGTEVGRALFALYNGYGVARNRGNKYSDHNRMKIMERISAQGLPGSLSRLQFQDSPYSIQQQPTFIVPKRGEPVVSDHSPDPLATLAVQFWLTELNVLQLRYPEFLPSE